MFYLCDVSNGLTTEGYTILCTLDEYHEGDHEWSNEPKFDDLDPPVDTAAMWEEVNAQQALTPLHIRQVTCGLTTHAGPACRFCGAIV